MLVVKTGVGALEGSTITERLTGNQVDRFLGVPYAQPPTGPRRFRAPVPAHRWEGVRTALDYGPSCPQLTGGPLSSLVPGMEVGRTAEDCLTLNVWTPSGTSEAPLPVMFWLHGGAFTIGGTALETYDPSLLVAEQQVVAVSANYRLGALGFLSAGPELTDSNCGLLDQLLALRWVQDHVAAFGGDPDRVTVFGESAGAGAALHLLASPLSKGLFSGAILQSPGAGQTLTAERAAQVAEVFLSKVGVGPGDREGLESIPVEKIIAAQTEAASELRKTIGSMPFHPEIDGHVLDILPLAAARSGRLAPRPIIAGTTAEEMRLYADRRLDQLDSATLASVLGSMASTELDRPFSTDDMQTVVESYLADTESTGRDAFAAVATDAVMRLPLEEFLDAYAELTGPVYAYSFAWRAAAGERDPGACHAIDLPFSFGTLDRAGWAEFTGADEDADRLSAAVRAAWASFARTGAPDVPGIAWPPYRPPQRDTLVLGRRIAVVEDPLSEARVRCDPIKPRRTGGLARWAPRVMPGIGRRLTPHQELACAFRILASTGFSENIAGHITVAVPGGDHLLVNPWGLWWEEITASDICEITSGGEVVDGRWDVTPAIHIHTELHRRRPDARVVVHNHPYYCTVLAAVGVLPEIAHQTGSMFDGDLGLVSEYDGEVDDADLGRQLADRIGNKSVVVLASHGVIVTGPTIHEAVYRAASFDRMCRLTYDTMLLGRAVLPIPAELRSAMKASLLERGSTVYWEGAVRQLLRDAPEVLS
ncbi:MAG TPA: carboxylesterase family protein [Acidimicrobiales bacterium]